MLHNMAGDRRYGVERIRLGIVEVIILGIFVPTVPLEASEIDFKRLHMSTRTVVNWPPDNI